MKRAGTNTRMAGFAIAAAVMYLGITAFSGGITNRTQKNGDGCTCHGLQPTATVSVAITGPDALSAGATGTYTVTISGGPLAAAGTNIAASDGVLAVIAGQGLQKLGDELTHTGPKTPVQGAVTFEFSYTAPGTPGTITLYANGNSVNLNGASSGDQWSFATNRTVEVTPATSVDDAGLPLSFALRQNFPNPFNPSTTIAFTLPEAGPVRIDVFAASGALVGTVVDGELPAGLHRREFDASGLASGTYLYRLVAGSGTATRRMTLIR